MLWFLIDFWVLCLGAFGIEHFQNSPYMTLMTLMTVAVIGVANVVGYIQGKVK